VTRRKFAVGSFVVEPDSRDALDRRRHRARDHDRRGIVIHTGDFKFDEAPPDGETFDVERFPRARRRPAFRSCSRLDEHRRRRDRRREAPVGAALEEIVLAAKGAVVVALFASNVHRLRMLGDIAQRAGRYIVPLGRSVGTHARVRARPDTSNGRAISFIRPIARSSFRAIAFSASPRAHKPRRTPRSRAWGAAITRPSTSAPATPSCFRAA
jgi:hypothetical protein